MSQKTYRCRVVWRLVIALILAVCLCLISPLPAAAQSIEDYFQFSYEPVSFSKSEIQGSEAFSATVKGRATCNKDLPVSVGEASITMRVIAENKEGDAKVTLNSSYTINIKPFPSKEGDTFEINQVVPLKFPAQTEPGNYSVIGKPIEAKVKVAFAWMDVTEYFNQDLSMGSVKYTTPEPTSTPEPTTIPTPTPAPTEAPVSIEYAIHWWVWLIVAIAVATTAVNIIWFLRQRIL